MTGLPVKAIFSSVTVYNKHVYSECNLLTQIEQVSFIENVKIFLS
jgi:hypothetical protein